MTMVHRPVTTGQRDSRILRSTHAAALAPWRPAGHAGRADRGLPEIGHPQVGQSDLPGAQRRKPEDAMIRTPSLLTVCLLSGALCGPVEAQDVQGVELCTHETRMDRLAGCLQSNVQYLHGLIAKNAADTQRKLGGTAAEIGELNGEMGKLKGEIGALNSEIAALKAALAAEQASVEKLQAAGKRAPPPEKPAAK